jgi:hypothetical protein
MNTSALVCLVFAFVLFVLGALAPRFWPEPPARRYDLLSAGLAFWVLATLLPLMLK